MNSRHVLTGLAMLTTCMAATAQSFTSPSGFASTEGSRAHGYVVASVDGMRWQQVDATQRGTPRAAIREIAFRRDALLPANASFGSRTLRGLTIVMAHSAIGTLSADLDQNYLSAPVTVFGPRDVTLPDWSAAPGATPAPFDMSLTLDVPFAYNGTDDLLWEIQIQSVSPQPTTLQNFPFDFEADPGDLLRTTIGGTFLGQGCIAEGQTFRRFVLGTEISNQAGQLLIKHSVNYGPPNTPVLTLFGATDPNIALPTLCAALRTDGLVSAPIGTSSSTGSVPAATVVAPHSPAFIGLDLFLQGIAVDGSQSGIGVALTQGVRLTIPADPTLPNVAHAYQYPTPAGSIFSMIETGGIVARLSE